MTAHKHAAIFEQIAQEAKTDQKFYEKWECLGPNWQNWDICKAWHLPGTYVDFEYRRKPAKPRECWATWGGQEFAVGGDPWGGAWPVESKPESSIYTPLHMIEVTPEVRAALAAAGIEVSHEPQ